MYYYLFVFLKVGLSSRKTKPEHIDEPVSVIICAKDESENLSKILPLALEQNYPCYEVIVVNDNSMDDIEDVLLPAQKLYPHLQIRNLIANNSVHGRSVVLGVGIKAAKYDRVIITDVNCRPSANWLKSLSSGFDSPVVMGYTRYRSVGKFIRAANFSESLFMLGYALNRRPYSASGENAGFSKTLFFAKNFNPMLRKLEKVEQVFFNSIMNRRNTSVVLTPESIVESEKTLSFINWCIESSGALFSRRLFRRGSRHVKMPEMMSKIVFYTSAIAAIVLTANIAWLQIAIVGVVVLRLIVQITVFHLTLKKLGEKRLLLSALLWDLYSVFVYFYVFMLIKHRKTIRRQ
jgi:glycosyltransferase involved in cell wall biosynthesis